MDEGGWNSGLAVIGALACEDPEAPASNALLRPLAAACMLLWFSWGQSITNKVIVSGALRIGHGLHQFGAQTLHEALYLLLLGIHKTWSISGQVVECVHILCESLCSLSEPQKFSRFHEH